MRLVATLLLIVFAPLLPLGWAVQTPAPQSWIAGETYQGVSITADLPVAQQMKNRSGTDGSGMCVLSSIEMAARHQGLEEMRGVRNYFAQREKGGSWPQRVDQQLKAWFAAKGLQPIPYLQYEGKSPESVMDLASKTSRMLAIAYGYSPRYGGVRAISHMTNAVLFNGTYGVVLDNNFPCSESKPDNYEWMNRAELLRRMRINGGTGGAPTANSWIFVWINAPPPPPRLPGMRPPVLPPLLPPTPPTPPWQPQPPPR